MRLKDFVEKTLSEIQDGASQALDLDCEVFTVNFTIAITDADEPGIFIATTFPDDQGNRVSFVVPIKAYKSSK